MNFLFGRKNRSRTISFLIIIAAYIFIQVLTHTVRVSRLFTSLLVPTCCYIVLALSLNLVVGFSGELSLGHAGFMAVGAFTAVSVSGLMSSVIANDILRLIVSIVVGSIVAAIFGLIISVPVLKLSGDYLAIVTLAFGQIIKSLINNVFLGFDKNGLHFSFVTNELNMDGGKMLLSGPMGATDTAKISNFSAGIILILITLFVNQDAGFCHIGFPGGHGRGTVCLELFYAAACKVRFQHIDSGTGLCRLRRTWQYQRYDHFNDSVVYITGTVEIFTGLPHADLCCRIDCRHAADQFGKSQSSIE